MYKRQIHDVVAQLKSRLMEELQHFNQMIIDKQSGCGIYVVELAFEHAENILNTNFSMFDFCTLTDLISVTLPIVDTSCFWVTALNVI